jgi:glycosyltransferase involved in cell wall biosynthesis
MDPAAIGKALIGLSRHALFSVIVPVYNTDPGLLRRMIASVEAQWYSHWELVLVDDHSTSPAVREVLSGLIDPRIVIVQIAENRGIAGASNEGIARATGDFIVFLDHDDELTVDCLYELALRIDRDDPDYLYSDEDKLDANGNFVEPFFKPDWSPDTLMSIMFTCHVSCVRRSLALELGGLRSEYDGSQDWDFVLRVSERARRIAHVSKVLYHWRITPGSCASDLQAKPWAIEAGKRAREDALRRRNQPGELVPVPELPGYYRTRYCMRGQPLVSILIPSKNNGAVLKACIDSIFERTTYRPFEIVVINNGSTDASTLDYLSGLRRREGVRVLDYNVPFNYSEINNAGVRSSRGELLVFLNDDTEVLSADWLSHMGGYAQLPHVGAVGAKLLYPGARTVQHSGVLNLTNGPCHAFARIDARAPGYFARNMLEYNWLAVTGACLMIERKKFETAGEFDEDLAVAYNDIALCLSLAKHGFHQVVCPAVELIHHESFSRGKDGLDRARTARGERERTIMFGKHPDFFDRDPFHNPNLAPNDVYFGVRQ